MHFCDIFKTKKHNIGSKLPQTLDITLRFSEIFDFKTCECAKIKFTIFLLEIHVLPKLSNLVSDIFFYIHSSHIKQKKKSSQVH